MATQRLRPTKYPQRRVDLPQARLLASAANEGLTPDRIAAKLNLAEDVVAELAPIFKGLNETQLAWAVETRNEKLRLTQNALRHQRAPFEDLAGRLPMFSTFPSSTQDEEADLSTRALIELFCRDAPLLESVLRTACQHGPLSESEKAQVKDVLWQLGIARIYASRLPSRFRDRPRGMDPKALTQAAGYRSVAASLSVVQGRIKALCQAFDALEAEAPSRREDDAFRYAQNAARTAESGLSALDGSIASLKRRSIMLRRAEHEAALGVRVMEFPALDEAALSHPLDVWLDDRGLCLRRRLPDGAGPRERLRIAEVKVILPDLPEEYAYLTSAPELDLSFEPALLDWDAARRQHIVVPARAGDPKTKAVARRPTRAAFIDGAWLWVTPVRARRS